MIKNLTKIAEKHLASYDAIRDCECVTLGIIKGNSMISLSVSINLFSDDVMYGNKVSDSGNMILDYNSGKMLLENGFRKINFMKFDVYENLIDELNEIAVELKRRFGKMSPDCLLAINVDVQIHPDPRGMDYSSFVD
jgi:hypothetical protein